MDPVQLIDQIKQSIETLLSIGHEESSQSTIIHQSVILDPPELEIEHSECDINPKRESESVHLNMSRDGKQLD